MSAKKAVKKPPKLKVTPLEEWEEGFTEMLTLPSKRVCKVKRVSLLDLVALGQIPDPLTGMVERALNDQNRDEKLTIEQYSSYMEVVNIVLVASLLEPKVSLEENTGVLWINSIDSVDKMYLFNWANGVSEFLEPFRRQEQIRNISKFPGS